MRFFDAYAIIAVSRGAPSYEPYRTGGATTHAIHVVEAIVFLLRRGVSDPWSWIERLQLQVISSDREDWLRAARIKASDDARRRNLSHADALGYAIANRLGLPFLTGDRGFAGLPGVELVRE